MIPIKKLRSIRQAASKKLLAATEEWEEEPNDMRLADKVSKARREWESANDEYERVRRRFEWERARRIIKLAARGRGQQEAQQFEKAAFRRWG